MFVHKVVDKWGRLDVLVHAAVIMPVISFEKTSHAAWWHEVFINLGGLFNGTKAVWEVMKAQGGGHIMSVASLSSFHGFANEVAYCVGKHGQEGFAKSLSIEAVPHNIAINTMGAWKANQAIGGNCCRGRAGARRREINLDGSYRTGSGLCLAGKPASKQIHWTLL